MEGHECNDASWDQQPPFWLFSREDRRPIEDDGNLR